MSFFSSSSFGGLAGGLVGGIAGAFGGNPALGASIGANIGSMLGPSQERLANRQYTQQYRDSIALWNMANQYNSPLEQRRRLVEAGYNPMLLQGADTASSISQPSYPQVHSSNRGSGISASVAKFFQNKQMENAEDQSRMNALNEEYLGLRNELTRAKIQNELTKHNKGATVKERGIKDAIDEARLRKLQIEIDKLTNGYGNGSLTNINTYLRVGENLVGSPLAYITGYTKQGDYKVRWPTREQSLEDIYFNNKMRSALLF